MKCRKQEINSLLVELMENPETGTGKPEKLKHDFSGRLSRRINHKHRLVYSIDNDTVCVISAWGTL
ncbi:MAG: Txe/YoeB family addiction module toxin [Bacteroidales bacterium]|jgi:toxin YoeB|nr:Txe/YoeB family addiction module toxin [Bacteroidales bacterium]